VTEHYIFSFFFSCICDCYLFGLDLVYLLTVANVLHQRLRTVLLVSSNAFINPSFKILFESLSSHSYDVTGPVLMSWELFLFLLFLAISCNQNTYAPVYYAMGLSHIS